MLQMKVVDNSISHKSSEGAYVCLPLPSGSRRLKRLPCLKYYNAQQWESTFTRGLNAAKITDKIKQRFKLKLSLIQFPTKNSVGSYVYLLQEWS